MRSPNRILASTLTLLLTVLAAPARGQTGEPVDVRAEPEPENEVSFDLTWASAYVWRGVAFTDGAVFQPSLTSAHRKGLSFNVWGNLDMDDSNDLSGDFQEVDLTLSYALPIESAWAVEVGFIEYLFPNGVGEGTREVFTTFAWEGSVTPSVSLYYDFDEVEDLYASFALSYATTVGPLGLEIAASAGHAGDDFALSAGGDEGGLFDGNLSLTLGYSTGRYSLAGFIAYTDTLDDGALPDQDVGAYGGFSLSFSP